MKANYMKEKDGFLIWNSRDEKMNVWLLFKVLGYKKDSSYVVGNVKFFKSLTECEKFINEYNGRR